MKQNEFKRVGKTSRRVWRWIAWTWWKTAWKWYNWQNARKGGGVKAWFEWWQTPLYKRLPKLKWFNNKRFRTEYIAVNVKDLERFDWKKVDAASLHEARLIPKLTSAYKVLWYWDIKAKIEVKTFKISTSAKSKIEKAWGKVELIK